MNEYMIFIIRTDSGRLLEVRKKGRLFWRVLGQFKHESGAVDCINKDIGGNGGSWEYYPEEIDRRSGRKTFHVWVLEYKTYQNGLFRKETEEFLTEFNARLHKWLYGFDKTKLQMEVRREERGK